MKPRDFLLNRALCTTAAVIVLTGFVQALPTCALAAGEPRFASAEEAVNAVVTAAKAKDTNTLRSIFGPEGRGLASADVVQATDARDRFLRRLTEKVELVRVSDSKVTLQLGADGWPFPIPLVKEEGRWFFDTAAGREEILNRRIGMNELGAIRVCRAYVDAQREYASQDRNGDEVLCYAQQLRSTPGKRDGLYWRAEPEEELSPFGPLIAQAKEEGYRRETKIMTEAQSPYRGYYFKILTKQGRHAPGGKYNYVINGNMIGGFAFVAWPAQWGNTGIMTFIVNQQGKVYQKNLGPKTASVVKTMQEYDPDNTWTLSKD
ncbi:MAG: DUF2950 domain-containing protein [Verrucomicrobia bacterium]|nr:DUF2950 domain-containing protein [Verrucomicrobiota bacterium]